MGLPNIDLNSAYAGHYANDGAGIDEYSDMDIKEELGMEDNIAAYERKSEQMRNARHQPFRGNNAHMVTVAMKDIKKGEEILVT